MTYAEAGRGCPNAVALAVEDGGLVDISSADEATSTESQTWRMLHVPRCRPCVPLVNVCYERGRVSRMLAPSLHLRLCQAPRDSLPCQDMMGCGVGGGLLLWMESKAVDVAWSGGCKEMCACVEREVQIILSTKANCYEVGLMPAICTHEHEHQACIEYCTVLTHSAAETNPSKLRGRYAWTTEHPVNSQTPTQPIERSEDACPCYCRYIHFVSLYLSNLHMYPTEHLPIPLQAPAHGKCLNEKRISSALFRDTRESNLSQRPARGKSDRAHSDSVITVKAPLNPFYV